MDGQRRSYPLAVMCQALGVTRAGYYAWRNRRGAPPGPREARREELVEQIRGAHEQSRCTYGSPRVYHRLKAGPGEGLVHHSDRGVQYTSGQYRGLLRSQGIGCSMSRRGDCYDNAAAESFFKTLKAELVYHEDYQTREQARRSVFEYVEVFYNRKRLHSALGYRSPEQFEAAMN